MSKQTVAEILEAYALWDDMVRKKQAEIDRRRSKKTSTKSIYGESRGGIPESMADYAAEMDLLDRDLDELKEERFKAYSEIMRLALQLKSQRQFDIIYRRNIHRDTWRRICWDLDIKRSTATDLHARAVRALEIINGEHTNP